MLTQCDMIFNHMKTFGAIDDNDARDLYGIRRLPARINDLRNEGHKIQTIMTESKNRFGKTVHFARYILMEAQ